MTDHADDGPSLVGARIGNLQVIARTKPGRRVQYLVEHGPTGRRTAKRGYQLVRLARAARTNGLVVRMPAAPWRDEGQVTHG